MNRSRNILAFAALFGIAGLLVLTQRETPTRAADGDEKPALFETEPGSWPMFGGSPARNMVNLTDKDIPTDFEAPDVVDLEGGTNIKWAAALGSKAYGGPVIAGGKIFVGTNNDRPRNDRDREKPEDGEELGRPIDRGILMCFDEKTGEFLWQAVHDKLPSGLVHDWPKEGICSAPVVEGNRLYYVSNRCTVVCADTNGFKDGNQGDQNEKYKTPIDADIIWQVDMMGEMNVFPHNLAVCSPMIIGDILFVVTSNGVDAEHINVPAPNAPSFIAMDKKTGKLLWKRDDPGKDIMHGQWSNPTYADIDGVPQVIFPGGDGWLYSLEPATGKLLWKFFCNPYESEYELGGRGTRSDFIATPVVYNNKVYIGVGQDPEHFDGVGHLWCIDPSKATPEKTDISPAKKPDGTMDMDPASELNKDSGLVWHYGGMETRKGSNREFKFGRTMSTCAIVDDILYVAELNGYLFCFDAKSGKKFWHYDLKAGIWGSPYYVDGKVYIGNEEGDVFIFHHLKDQPDGMDEDDEPDNEKKRELRKAVEEKFLIDRIFVDDSIRSTPVVANGILYLMTERMLLAIEEKE